MFWATTLYPTTKHKILAREQYNIRCFEIHQYDEVFEIATAASSAYFEAQDYQ